MHVIDCVTLQFERASVFNVTCCSPWLGSSANQAFILPLSFPAALIPLLLLVLLLLLLLLLLQLLTAQHPAASVPPAVPRAAA
jgi:hypothetical protein